MQASRHVPRQRARAGLIGPPIACAGAHFRARELGKLGHEVRLTPPSYVKPYVKRGKTDAADAGATAQAVTRPSMRCAPVKTEDQQAVLTMHRTRTFWTVS